MKKILKISSNNTDYKITCGEKSFEISKEQLTIYGKDIFETIFYDIILEDYLEIDYIEENITDSGDVRIVNDIKKVVDSIVAKINEKVEK